MSTVGNNRKLYVAAVISFALLVLGTVAGINLFMDPFGMYRLWDREGINAIKPGIYQRVRLLKAYELRRVRPESIVVGSSRVHLGFDPEHPGWQSRYQRRYNLAFDGATTREMYEYIVHTHSVGELKHVMLGLDTYHPTSAPGFVRPDFDADLLMSDRGWPERLGLLAADLRLLTGVTTLRESLATLRAQSDSNAVWLAANGQRLGDVFFRRPSENFFRKGPRYYFDEIDRLEVRYKLEWKIPVPPKPMLAHQVAPSPDPVSSLGYIEKIISFCQENGIELDIFLTPEHAHQLEISAATGAWWSVENGKRELVKRVSKANGRRPDLPPIELVDFSSYSSVSTEPLPPIGSFDEMQNYWDSSHFKDNVGDLVLDRLLRTPAEGQVPKDFGIRLTEANIDEALGRIREAQSEYRRRYPEDIERIADWVEDFKRKHGIED